MEEREYRSTYQDVNPRECPFERAILRRCASCRHVRRIYLAEREAIGCQHEGAFKRCSDFFDHALASARFALKLLDQDMAIAHGKRIKVECGALIGLRNLLAATDASQQPDSGQAPVADAGELVASAVIHHGAVDTIPYQQLMPAIVHFQARSRRR